VQVKVQVQMCRCAEEVERWLKVTELKSCTESEVQMCGGAEVQMWDVVESYAEVGKKCGGGGGEVQWYRGGEDERG